MKKALLFDKIGNKKVKCQVCHHHCLIANGQRGVCKVRENQQGTLYAINYMKIIASHVDPIEKKPLFHFLPGTLAYSIATVGCNFKCLHCQNYSIAQDVPKAIPSVCTKPHEIVEQAQKNNCHSIAYTYTEPTIFLETSLEIMSLAKEKGLKNIWVSNGYFSQETLELIKPYLDAINIDLKFWNAQTYLQICRAKLQPVLESLKLVKQNNIWLEVTTLIIPTLNDSKQDLCSIAEFIAHELGSETPWHVSAFFPANKLTNIYPTPASSIRQAYDIGKQAGLKYIYGGNIDLDNLDLENTICPGCQTINISRNFYEIKRQDKNGRCHKCGESLDVIE